MRADPAAEIPIEAVGVRERSERADVSAGLARASAERSEAVA